MVIAYIGLCMDEERRSGPMVPMVPISIQLPRPSQGNALNTAQTYLQPMDTILNGTAIVEKAAS